MLGTVPYPTQELFLTFFWFLDVRGSGFLDVRGSDVRGPFLDVRGSDVRGPFLDVRGLDVRGPFLDVRGSFEPIFVFGRSGFGRSGFGRSGFLDVRGSTPNVQFPKPRMSKP